MNGTELRHLSRGRVIQMNNDTHHGRLDIIIQKQPWKTHRRTWEETAKILNMMGVGGYVKDKLKDIKCNEVLVIPLDIPTYIDE